MKPEHLISDKDDLEYAVDVEEERAQEDHEMMLLEVEVVHESEHAISSNQPLEDEEELVEEGYDEEVLTESVDDGANGIDMNAYFEVDPQNQQVVIFKTNGDATDESVVTYSIPISNTGQYDLDDSEREFDAIDIKNQSFIHPHQSYEIIDGYLVPTNSQSQTESLKEPIAVSSPEQKVLSRPILPNALTPDVLRRKSRQQPENLLIIYHCSFCSSAYEDYSSIKLHEAEHIRNGDPVMLNTNPQTNYLGTKLFPGSDFKHHCPFCLMGFDMSSLLGKHIRQVHKKERRSRKARHKSHSFEAKKLRTTVSDASATTSNSICSGTAPSFG